MLQHKIKVGTRTLKTTPVYEAYWRFAYERQAIFFRRIRGDAILTNDVILSSFRFTNVYRASDRVSQYLISEVIKNSKNDDPEDVFFRTILFKIFNKIETWELLEKRLGQLHWKEVNTKQIGDLLTNAAMSGRKIYSGAYIIPSPALCSRKKHLNHLALIENLLEQKTPHRILASRTLRDVYNVLSKIPSFGPFLAFQYAIDLNYGPMTNFSEMEFVMAGPGAIDGIAKCFEDAADFSPEEIIRLMADIAQDEFARYDLRFATLGQRPLQLIDCQNLFCEIGKYARQRYPELRGVSGRTRIKRKFSPSGPLPPPQYPAKWNLAFAMPDRSLVPVLEGTFSDRPTSLSTW